MSAAFTDGRSPRFTFLPSFINVHQPSQIRACPSFLSREHGLESFHCLHHITPLSSISLSLDSFFFFFSSLLSFLFVFLFLLTLRILHRMNHVKSIDRKLRLRSPPSEYYSFSLSFVGTFRVISFFFYNLSYLFLFLIFFLSLIFIQLVYKTYPRKLDRLDCY